MTVTIPTGETRTDALLHTDPALCAPVDGCSGCVCYPPQSWFQADVRAGRVKRTIVPLEIVTLKDEHLKGVAALVCSRYRAPRECVPILPARYEHVDITLPMLRDIAAQSPGVAAIHSDRLVGFLAGWVLHASGGHAGPRPGRHLGLALNVLSDVPATSDNRSFHEDDLPSRHMPVFITTRTLKA